MPDVLLEDQVIDFIAHAVNVRRARLSMETTLFGDLGVDGDEGDKLLTGFMEHLGVDMSGCRPVHFGPEGFIPWAPLYWLVLWWRSKREVGSTPESRARLVPITIRDLVEAANARRWMIKYQEAGQQRHPTACGESASNC